MTSSNHKQKVWNHFEKTITDYDTCDNFVVPRNEEVHQKILEALPYHPKNELKIMDLGSGTGKLALKVLSKFEKSQITGIDFSKKMISKAKAKLSYFGDRFEAKEADFNEIEFGTGFDAVVSSIAIHNNTDDNKKTLFKKIYNSLNMHGSFINGDFIKYADEIEQKRQNQLYRMFLEENLYGHELQVWLEHAFEQDIPATLDNQFGWLKEAGFKEPKLLWNCKNLAIYSAKK
ncbi:MAG: class I SAM-dependent methyltransferase [Candidatus Diapherotrites archaeon]